MKSELEDMVWNDVLDHYKGTGGKGFDPNSIATKTMKMFAIQDFWRSKGIDVFDDPALVNQLTSSM